MASATSVQNLVERFSALDPSLPSHLFADVATANGELHIDEECSSLAGTQFGVKFETRSLESIHDELECAVCTEYANRPAAIEALEELIAEAVSALLVCERSDQGLPRITNMGALINSLRPNIWMRAPAVEILLRALEQRFVPDLPGEGVTWLVMRGAGAPLVLLNDGIHHASGYSLLLLPKNFHLVSTPSRPLSVREPYASRRLCESVKASELHAVRQLFFQMVIGGTDPHIALQAALSV